jgi:hypothetical protein
MTSEARAAPVVHVGTTANAAQMQAEMDQFREDLGGSDNGTGGSFATGRREINWDDVPDSAADPNFLPFDYFNSTAPRGVVLESVANVAGQHRFRVSADASNPTLTPVRFGDLDASYPGVFTTFSPERLFSPAFATFVDIMFFVPGTTIPATVNGFGAIFADVDSGTNAYIEYFAPDGTKLSGSSLNTANNGLSFIGTSFNAGEGVARVEMGVGNKPLASGNVDGTNSVDVVALDDFIYGEPQPEPSTFRFADARVTGVEGGTATIAVVRSGPAQASVGFATTGGTATAGSDYTPSSGTLSFKPGETVKTFTVPIAADAVTDGDETVTLQLSKPVGGTLIDPKSATLSIVDRDETSPTLALRRVPRRMTLARFLRGVRVVATPNESSTVEAELLASVSHLALARLGDVTLASRRFSLSDGARSFKLAPKRRLVLPAPRHFTARLRVTAVDASGNRAVIQRRIRVSR